MRRLTLATLIGAAALTAPAYAYTPQSGLWWNPNESGTGFTIELQDNLMVFTAFVGDPLGTGGQEWYTAAGFLDPTATFFEADLFVTEGSQCAGCSYPGPADEFAVGTVEIEFDPDDEGQGFLTYNLSSPNLPARTVPVERFQFYLKRPEDGNAPVEVTKMLGEWHLTLDFSFWENFEAFRYQADVLVFDDFFAEDGVWYFEGCRAETSLDGFCSDFAKQQNYALGFYDTTIGRQAIFLDDDVASGSCLYYEADVGAEEFFAGETEDGEGGFILLPCSDDPLNYVFDPVRGFRTASRTFVEDGVGPSKEARDPSRSTRGNGSHLPRGFSRKATGAEKAARDHNPEFVKKVELLRQRMLERRAAAVK